MAGDLSWTERGLVCPACGGDLPPRPPISTGYGGNFGPFQQFADCPDCGAKLKRSESEPWVRTDGGWQPMPLEEARRVVAAMGQSGSTSAGGFARLMEARAVTEGRHPKEIRKQVEAILHRPLD